MTAYPTAATDPCPGPDEEPSTTGPLAGFRQVLAQFASGVIVVAAHGPTGPIGLTATAFASVSLVPPLILVCIGKRCRIHDGLAGAPYFGVSVLEEAQRGTAVQFAQSGIDRFRDVRLRAGDAAPVPLIDGALGQLECQRHACFDGGDHTVLLGRVLATSVGQGHPLLYYGREFGVLARTPEGGAPPAL